MKYQLQISTGQFEYIMQEGEFETPQSAVEAYKSLKEAYTAFGKELEGLSEKEFKAVIDRYLADGTGETEKYFAMNATQKGIIKAIQLSLARIARKNGDIN